jgi:tetratricopeptide (TPR) repeat protein
LAARSARRARAYEEAERLLTKYQQARGLNDAASFEQVLLSAERHVDRVDELCWRYVDQDHAETPLLLEALTRGYLRQYQLGKARLCLDRWLKRQPDNPQAWFLDGLFYLDYVHKQSEALASYRRAVELDPEHEEARLQLAVGLEETNAFAEAAEHLEYLWQHQPDNLGVQVGLAECRNGLGEVAEATRLVDGVLAQQPQYPPALALRGRIALEHGQYAEAETYLRQAVERSPADIRSHYHLSVCLHHNGKEAEAQRHQQQLQEMEAALRRFDEIVTRDLLQRPRDPALHCTLGKLMLRGGMRQEGLRWLLNALHLDPQYAPAREALKKYYEEEAAKQRQQD